MNVYEKRRIGEILKDNPYAGRGIVIGLNKSGGEAFFAYFIMGRSENSRNRIFIRKEGGEIGILPYDISKVEDPSLIIYSPVKCYKDSVIVTNGDQTETIYEGLKGGKSFSESLKTREFEPDKPNFTPRISGILSFEGGFSYEMSILKSADEAGSRCNRYTFSYSPTKGTGHFLHTYVTDGNPLPTFLGEPERVDMPERLEDFTKDLWNSLNDRNRISLYTRSLSLSGKMLDEQLININL